MRLFKNWLAIRMAFILSSLDMGAGRLMLNAPTFAEKRRYVEAKKKMKKNSKYAKEQPNRRGVRHW